MSELDPSTDQTPREPSPPGRLGPGLVACLVVAILLSLIGVTIGVAYQLGASRSGAEDVAAYLILRSIVDEIQAERIKPSPDFQPIRERATVECRKVADTMKHTAEVQFPARQMLLWAARDDMPRMLREDWSTPSEAEQEFVGKLNEVARELRIPSH